MGENAVRMYRIQEFAAKAGVTVRTLHHYDRIGLLKPRRTHTRYRVYGDADLRRLQQILVLKFLGLSLSEIAAALKSASRRTELLKNRRYAVRRDRHRLAIELQLLDELQDPAAAMDWAELASFTRVFGRNSVVPGSSKRSQLDEARRIISERRREWNATLQDYELKRDIRAAVARGDTPDSQAGQALVARWRDGIERFVGGDEKVRAAFQLVMADRSNWPNAPGLGEFQEYFDRALKQAS
jgi:DNA-binding transcriptional MerR regulator